jgi:hypothetical protein
VQCVHLVPTTLFLIRSYIPLPLQHFKITMNILFELPHTLRTKRMRNRLSLPRMLRSIPRIKQSSLDADKSVIILAFQKPIPMAVDLRYSICIRYTNVMRLQPHQLAVLGVCVVNRQVPLAGAALIQKP